MSDAVDALANTIIPARGMVQMVEQTIFVSIIIMGIITLILFYTGSAWAMFMFIFTMAAGIALGLWVSYRKSSPGEQILSGIKNIFK